METPVYAITDSHQESRNLSRLLSGIYNFEKDYNRSFLLLDAGDLFKGIYDRNLSVSAYLKFKKMMPRAQIFITLGNNDFGFSNSAFEYLINTVKTFESNSINVVCANLVASETKEFAPWVSRYKILEINNRKLLITGLCINTSCVNRFGYELISPEECFKKLISSIDEDYDNIIVLNHHWYPYSFQLKNTVKNELNKDIDLIIGGHEHSYITPDYENNIFYPFSFARSLYKMMLDKNISNVEEVKVEDLNFIPEFENPIKEYEEKTELCVPVARRVLNLTKCYSDPCPLGTFISDNMMRVGKTDIAFHSTGFTMWNLKLQDSDVITNYDLKRTMCADCVLVKIEITIEELKKVFENATQNRMYRDRGNSKFVQCSSNIKITGKRNKENNTYKILQIEINGEELLNSGGNPITPARRFSCTIDPYIGSGEQGFAVLKNIPKTEIMNRGIKVKIDDLLRESLKLAQDEFPDSNGEYPVFQLIDL